MPRKPRSWSPGAIHHAIARGHCGSPIFATDDDRAFVLARAVRAFRETGATCLAWSVMVNHYHVLVRCEGPPGETFSRLNSAIAWRESRRRGERGAVFQGRFNSDTCDDEESLLSRFGYVLGNPIHHRVVPSVNLLRTYEWSGLGEILGLRKARLVDTAAALAVVHPDPVRARETLLDLLEHRARAWAQEEGDPDADRSVLDVRVDPRAPDEVPPAKGVRCPPSRARRIDALRNDLRRQGWTPDMLVSVACRLTRAHPDGVRSGVRTARESAARAIVAFVACDVAGWPMVEAAPALGVRPTALGAARRRGRAWISARGASAERLLQASRDGASA